MAEGDLTETALQEQARFTIEEHALFSAVIGGKAVFQNKADRQAVAQIFRALEAETGAGRHARFHREAIGGILVRHVDIGMQILQAGIDEAVKLNVRSQSGTGKSAENGDSSQSLFHVDLLVFYKTG